MIFAMTNQLQSGNFTSGSMKLNLRVKNYLNLLIQSMTYFFWTMILMKQNRIKEREVSRISLEFYSVIMAFESRMLTNNFTTQKEEDQIIDKFNDIWLKFCSHWNTFDHSVQPNPFAFQNYLVTPFDVTIYNE